VKKIIRKAWAFIFGLILASAMLTPRAKADEWNEKTKLEFSAPVEIPGTVLPAGAYWFLLANSPSNRHIVEVYNQSLTHLCATFIAIPTYRMKATGYTEIKFAERPHDKPEAMWKWYYPGRLIGQELIYSHRHEREFTHDAKRDLQTPAVTSSYPGMPQS